MREYELTVIYDLALTESQGAEASLEAFAAHVESRGGRLLSIDHWGRRRMAYPIKGAMDGDYIVSRVELEPAVVRTLEDAMRIDERVYRYLIVRADELPPPPPPRAPRRPLEAAAPRPESPPAVEAPAAAPEAAATVPEATATAPEAEATAPEAAVPAPEALEAAVPAPEAPEAAAEAPEAAPVEAAEPSSPKAAGDTADDEVSTAPATVDGETSPSA